MDKGDIVKEWLYYANMDVTSADYLMTMIPAPYEIICYHCQQSAEKFLKAYTIYYGADDNDFKNWFRKWYRKNRIDENNNRKSENLWTYFEAAQIHNAFLLGYAEDAWKSLDGFLDDPRFGGMSIYFESEYSGTEMLPYNNAPDKKGWLKKGAIGANMPHNWTSAEMFNLLRDMFVREDLNNNKLLLANGIPEIWRKPGNKIGVKNMPTMFGEVSYMITFKENGNYDIDYKNETPAEYSVML